MKNIFQKITEEQYKTLSTWVDKHYTSTTIDFLKKINKIYRGTQHDIVKVFAEDPNAYSPIETILELGTFIDEVICKEKSYTCEMTCTPNKIYEESATEDEIRKEMNLFGELTEKDIQEYFEQKSTEVDWDSVWCDDYDAETSPYYKEERYFLFGWDYFVDKYKLREVA